MVVVEEVQLSKPVVRIPSVEIVEERKKRRRIGEMTEEEEEAKEVREMLVALLCPRAICEELMRRVEKESVFKNANPKLVVGDNPTDATVGVFWGTDTWRQSLGVSGGYLLRPRVSYRGGLGYRERGMAEEFKLLYFHTAFR